MLIFHTRTAENHMSTISNVSIGGPPLYHALEDGKRVPKVPGETRIPAGEYRILFRTAGQVHVHYLARFGSVFHKGMLWLQDVPGFEFVYYHCGNLVAETEGCPLIGSHIIPPVHDGEAFSIGESEKAYRLFYPRVRDELLAGGIVRTQIIDPAAAPLVA